MLENSSTEQLLQQARAGDRDAFEQLVKAFRPRVEGFVRLRLGSELRGRVEVDDIIQETFIRAHGTIATLRSTEDGLFFRWLAGIAHHVILNEARHHERRPMDAYDSKVPADDSSLSKGLRRGERFDRLQDALDSLSPDHREVILLTRIEGLPLAEAAERMKRSQGAVAQLLWRALKNLRERFGDTESLRLPERRLQDRGGRNGP